MKKYLAFLLALVMVVSLCACGNTPDETIEEPETTEAEPLAPEETEEPDNSIPLRPFKMNAVFTNTETGDSFTLFSPVEEALSYFEECNQNEFKGQYRFYFLRNDVMRVNSDINIYDYLYDGQKVDGFIDSVGVYSEKWIFNNELHVGMPFEEIRAKWGEAEGGQGEYSYYFENEFMGAFKTNILCNDDEVETIKSFSVFPIGSDDTYHNHIPIPQYVSDELGIYDVSVSEPNSANGVNFLASFANMSTRTIKYITFTITPYNAVNDPVSSEIGNESTKSFQIVGPIEQSQTVEKTVEENAWYNKNIDHVVIESIEVIYMDAPDVVVCYQIED